MSGLVFNRSIGGGGGAMQQIHRNKDFFRTRQILPPPLEKSCICSCMHRSYILSRGRGAQRNKYIEVNIGGNQNRMVPIEGIHYFHERRTLCRVDFYNFHKTKSCTSNSFWVCYHLGNLHFNDFYI